MTNDPRQMGPTPGAPGAPGEPIRLRAGCCVLDADTVLAGVEVMLDGGVVTKVRELDAGSLSQQEAARVLAPGFVNAHTHLDLGALRQRVPAGRGFTAWVGDLVAQRAQLDHAAVDAGVAASAEEALRTGTTAVIDIDSCGRTRSALESVGAPLRAAILTEVLDGSPAGLVPRSRAALDAAVKTLGLLSTDRHWPGVSPHGTHTVGDALLKELGARREKSPWPVAIHWAETAEEIEWLLHGTGPFADWLGPSPHLPGTRRLSRAGLLKGAILVHGNYPQPGEAAAVAEAGAAVVHCPGSHSFFDRKPFPFETYSKSGVSVALGTDSWASNASLDMRREMRLARRSLGLSAQTAWRMATEAGAKLLPFKSVTGKIHEGAAADLALFQSGEARASKDVLEWLTLEEPAVAEVWIQGIKAWGRTE